MAEEELRMLVNLSLSVADQDKKLLVLTNKIEVLTRNQATLTHLVNMLLEEKRDAADTKGQKDNEGNEENIRR